MKKTLKLGILITIILLAGATMLNYLQEKLIFIGAELTEERAAHIRQIFPQSEIDFHTPDGQILRGWWIVPKKTPPEKTIIYFGGNAEEISGNLVFLSQFPKEANILLIQYRGYGSSTGKPGEQALVADAILIYDQLIQRYQIKPEQVYLMGRSLGSGVAVQLAAKRQVQGVILVTPFDSLEAVAKVHYPFLPVSLVLKHKFDSISFAKDIKIPALFLVSEKDQVVPLRHAEKLKAAWGGETRWIEFKGRDHHDLQLEPAYWQGIREFLGQDSAL